MEVLNLQIWIDEFGEDQLNLNELKDYLEFVNSSKVVDETDEYTEWHHIMPKCIDKEKKFRDQGVTLKGRDHLRAHLLIVDVFKCNSYRRSLGYAVRQMSRDPLGERKLTPEEFEEVRQKFSEGVRGTKMTESTRHKISETLGDGRLKGEGHPSYGKHRTDETKFKISKSNKLSWTEDKRREFSQRRKGHGNPCYGKKLPSRITSEETKSKLSTSGKDKIWINDGQVSTKISKDQEIPKGWNRGRLSFKRSSNGQEGKIWIVNSEGVLRKVLKDSIIPEGFQRGKVWRDCLED